MRTLMILALGCAVPGAASAQNVVARAGATPVRDVLVPAHTEIVLRLDEEVASNRTRVGQPVMVSVARDVMVDNAVLIPRGTAGHGVVTGQTGKGAFGKSGKLDIELRSIDVGGRAVPIVGRYHAAGEGRAGETIGTILIGGVIAGAFVTGRHAVFEEGREFTAFTADATRIAMPAGRIFRPAPSYALLARVAPASGYGEPVASNQAAAFIDVGANDVLAAPQDDMVGRFQRRLAAAQPVRGGDRRQGWTISD